MEYHLKLKAGNEMDKCVFLFIYLSFAKQQRLATSKKDEKIKYQGSSANDCPN